MSELTTDVLVVDAGPAGLTAAALLARLGVSSLTASKYGATADSPRAHITNQRAVEIFRDLGIEERGRLRALPLPLMGEAEIEAIPDPKAHAAHAGVDVEKIAHAFEFETHPGFSDRERAALRLARDAALVPNLVTAEHFEALRRHFDEAQIVELVAVCALFGFLNRWNDTMSTELESTPRAVATEHLAGAGWTVDKHR